MAVRYLLDTNTVSYIIKGNVPGVRERLVKVPMSDVGMSVVTEAELRFGVARAPSPAKLSLAVEQFLLRVELLDPAEPAVVGHFRNPSVRRRIGGPHRWR